MSGIWTTDRIRHELHRLDEWRMRVHGALLRDADRLDAVGAIPSDELFAHLSDYRQRLRTVAQHLRLADSPDGQRLALATLFARLEQRQQTLRLTDALADIAALTHTDDPHFAPLAACREQAAALSADAVSADGLPETVIAELETGRHPLQALLRLIDQDGQLADEDWNQLHDIVSQCFGRTLSTAVTRRRIQRGTAVPVSSPVEAAPQPVREPKKNPTVAYPPLRSSVLDSPAADFDQPSEQGTNWFTSRSSILPGLISETVAQTGSGSNRSAEIEDSAAAPAHEAASPNGDAPPRSALELGKPVWHDDDNARLARSVMASSALERRRKRQALVLQLVRDNRPDLAAHLADVIDATPAERGSCLPAGLLRTLALAPALSYARGELARQVDQEFRALLNASLTETLSENAFGLSLLLRAAALRPALLGASPHAATLLRSFPIEPGLSQLYNFCSRVAAFGERLQNQAVDLFQAPAEQSQWQAERRQLQQEISHWLNQLIASLVAYHRTSPLFLHAHWTMLTRPAQRNPGLVAEWTKWQEVLSLIQRMLAPIRDGRDDERHIVRMEMGRAAALTQQEPAESDDQAASGRTLTAGMQERLLEAIDLANRGLRLQAAAPSRGLPLAPQHAEELRSELLARADGVIAELNALAVHHPAEMAQVGLLSCRRVVESVRQLCAGTAQLALHEPDARHVLTGELLKIPHLELDEAWRPTSEPSEREQALLEHLSCGWNDWPSAFALQCSQGDHVATARLLEMPVWPDSQTVNRLHQLRSDELRRSRQGVHSEVDELATQVALDTAQRPELQPEHDDLQERLDRVRRTVPHLLSFGRVRARLDRYRSRWSQALSGDSWRRDGLSPSLLDDSAILKPQSQAFHHPETPSTTDPNATTPAGWVFAED